MSYVYFFSFIIPVVSAFLLGVLLDRISQPDSKRKKVTVERIGNVFYIKRNHFIFK